MNTVAIPETQALEAAEAQQAAAIAEEAVAIAQAYTIDSPEMYEAAADELRSIAKKAKQLEDTRKTLTKPLDEAKKRIMDLFRGPLERLQEAEGLLRRSMLTWKREQDRKAEEARREAERQAREERERLERERQEAEARAAELARQASMVEDEAERERLELEAEAARQDAEAVAEEVAIAEVAPVAAPVVAAPKADGIAARTTWKFRVTDKQALIKAAAADPALAVYLAVDEKAIGGVVRALKAEARIPGVEVYAEQGLAVRRG